MEEDKLLISQNTENQNETFNTFNLDKSSEKNEFENFEEIINNNGYGPEQWKIIITAFTVLLSGYYNTFNFDTMILPLKKYYELSYLEIAIISSFFFLGSSVSNFSGAYLSKSIGKRNMVLFCAFNVLVLNFALYFSLQSQAMFILIRILMGVPLGLTYPIMVNTLIEYLPIKFRSITTMLVFSAFSLSQIFTLILNIFFLRNDLYPSSNDLANLYLSGMLVPVTSFILIFLFYEESPRSLILNENEKKSFEILEKISGKNLSEAHKKFIIKDLNKGSNLNKLNFSIKSIFCHITD